MTEQAKPAPDASAVIAVCGEIEKHVAASGWDQPARLFALVPTAALLAAEPSLGAALGEQAHPDGHLTAIEQDEFHAGGDLAADLERIAWPDGVTGCALSVERTLVPASVEADIPADPDAAAEFVNAHPQRHDVRVVVAVDRGGAQHGLARLRSEPDALLSGTELVPGLAGALLRTLDPS